MQERGILVDLDYVQRALQHENTLIEKYKREFKAETGHEYQDSRRLFEIIFKEKGEEYGKTDKGHASFSGDTLEKLTHSKTARSILKIRESEKRAGTYWSSFIHFADEKGIIRATAQSYGTTTGRFSYKDPNLQNIPKEDEPEDKEKEFVVRQSFVPIDGHTFVAVDFQQQEYRLMLDYANERSLIDMVNSGMDVHTATAEMVGVTRKQAKTINFALLYGTGVSELGRLLGVDTKTAQEMKRKYFARLPRVKGFINEVMDRAKGGFVYNWLGRRFWLGSFDYAYKIPNHLIQGSGADVVKKAMIETDPLADIVLQVHDEILFQIPDDRLDIVSEICKRMESVYKPRNGLGLTVSASKSKKSFAKRDLEDFDA